MKIHKFLTIVTALLIIFSESSAKNSSKIPAFARKYGYSCKTCHNPFPRLKPYGEDFAGSGFREKEEPKSAYKNTGDDLLTLMRELPLGVRIDLYSQFSSRGHINTDLKSPYLVRLLSGGNIVTDSDSKIFSNIGYYFYFYFSERGEVAGIEDAYVHFDNLFGTELDVMFGQFQVSDPMLKRELRLTYEDYELYKIKPGLSKANLTYDRGFMITYNLPSNTELVAEIVNGNGKPDADKEQNFDTDSEKAYVLRISQDVSFLRIGAFYYNARESLYNIKNNVKWYGPDLSIGNDNIELNYEYLIRQDDNPWFLNSPLECKIKSHIAELIYIPEGDESKWYGVLLYSKIKQNDIIMYHRVTANFTRILRRNFKFTIEYTRNIENKYNNLTFGFIAGF